MLLAVALPASAAAASGDLDPGFGVNGIAETDIAGGEDGARAVAVDAEGRIVAAGGGGVDDPSKPGSTAFSLARYTSDGLLDPSFGGDGRVQTDLGVQTQSIEAVMVNEQDRITVVGTATNFDGINSSITVVRYLPDGTLDASFGGNGIVALTPGFLNIARDALIDDRGNVVIAGLADGPGGLRPVVARLLPGGGLDPAFSGDGMLRIRSRSLQVVSAIAQTAGGGLALGGASEGDRMALLRLRPSGSIDRKFGSRGAAIVATRGDSEASDLAAADAGGLVVAGSCSCGRHGDSFAVARMKANGKLDRPFAKRGLLEVALGGPDTTSRATAVLVDSAGRIVVGGVRDPSGPAIEGALARLTPRGRLDRSFSSDGIAPGNALSTIAGLAQDPAGGILAAGQVTSTNLDSDLGLARFLP